MTPREAVGQRSETVRRANLSAIVRELHVRGPLSRSDLVALTGLTRSAIRGLIGELAAGGLVREERSEPAGTPGRPSPLVRPDAESTIVLAIEINVDSLAAAVVGFGGTVHELVRVDRPRAHLSLEEIVSDVVDLVAPMRASLPAEESLVGVGVAVAGIVRCTDGLHVGKWLGIGLAGLINVLNPSLVVLGGLFERIHPFVSDQLADVLERRALPASRELVSIVPGTLGVDGALLGAAEHAFEPLLADPAARLAVVRARRPALASA